jgi:hypothetical protein
LKLKKNTRLVVVVSVRKKNLNKKKDGNDDDLEGVGHDIETATHSPDNAFNISATTVISGIDEEAALLDVFRNVRS